MIKTVLVPIKNHTNSFEALSAAVEISRMAGARLTGLYVGEEGSPPEDEEEVRRRFIEITSGFSGQKTLEMEKGDPAGVILEWEKSSDIVIAGRPPRTERGRNIFIPGKTTDPLIRYSHHPVMIAGKGPLLGSKLILSYSGDRISSRCLSLAGEFSAFMEESVLAVVSETVQDKAVRQIKWIENYFKAFSTKPKIFWKRTNTARAVIETSGENNPSIIIMGSPQKPKWHSILFEDPSLRTAKNTEMPIVFCS